MATLGRLPRNGDVVELDEVTLTVERMEGRRIDRLRAVTTSGKGER
jgi:CBS domain containing-hemolysin-like protein